MVKNIAIVIVIVFVPVVMWGRGISTGLIPNSIKDANKNAETLVRIINSGFSVNVDDTYYIGSASSKVHRNINLFGSGSLVTTTGNNIIVDAPISITINGITLRTTQSIYPGKQNRFIVNEGVNYHRRLFVNNCRIEGVRVFTHVASDVDQKSVRDGIQEILFTGNEVVNAGDYIMLLTNCKAEKVIISNNSLKNILSIGFGLGVDNSFRDLGSARIKDVYFCDNNIDNTGFVLTDEYEYGGTYMTPILCEADYCNCSNNVFKNIIATKHKDIALYAFYLSCKDVLIKGNYIENCIHLGSSSYNEMFKCKGGPLGPRDRKILDNKYVITYDCLNTKAENDPMPCMRFTCFQAKDMGDIVIKNNIIDLACNFVFGAGARCSYKSYYFENNDIRYHDYGASPEQLLRLAEPLHGNGYICVRNNHMKAQVEPSKVYGLFLGDCEKYNFIISNNIFYGCLPTGEDNIDPSDILSFSSTGNTIYLGNSHDVVRICRNVNCDDKYIGGQDYSMFIYPSDVMNGSLHFSFIGSSPINIMLFNRLPMSGSCAIKAIDSFGSVTYRCAVTLDKVLVSSSKGGELSIDKAKQIKKASIGKPSHNLGPIISDGTIVYYSRPSSYSGDMEFTVDYSTDLSRYYYVE